MSKGTLLALVCVTAVSAQLSPNDRQDILDAHNNLRSQIALGNYVVNGNTRPSATNMLKMKWSSVLEAQSQAVSDKCVFKHSGTRGVGESLYTAYTWGGQTIDIAGQGKDASDAWSSEFEEYGWNNVTLGDEWKRIGHATQMAWAESGSIGCGASVCAGGTRVILVCQYQRPGNYPGRFIYKEGPTCSQCPSGTTCDELTGLCV